MEQLSTTNSNTNAANEVIFGENRGIVETFQYIVIRLGEEQYGIDIRYIDNIVRMQSITRIPKMPNYLRGVINLRGEVIPVISLRLKMDLPEDEITRVTRIIIIKTETEGNTGVLVDEVREVVTLSEDEIERVSRESKDGKTNFINGVGKHNNELISLLDLSSIALEENA
ncbi:MAG: chemotaxis protein CheW [Bacteroidales bacterium]|nr:chemotaxis protein CheW [Lachnoclostridium sp.]MCM1383477.1 chemotaxis protein CheW [Lachnoclostridium sp.]MCM1465345.1 chemotaxis protein CheW [Bacteroidales bacterium]